MRFPTVVLILVLAAVRADSASVRLTINDSTTRKPVPCRIHLKDSGGKPVMPPNLPSWKDHFVCLGEVQLELQPGQYSYELDRGPEYFLTNGSFSVSGDMSIKAELRRMIDLAAEGWWSGELHVHRKPAEVELLMQAEDL